MIKLREELPVQVRQPIIIEGMLTAARVDGNLRRWDQVHRRAELLAATRARLAEVGHEKVTLRKLAADCNVTVQTIFNIIGNRSQVLRDSITDLGLLIDHLARSTSDYPSYPIAFADLIWQIAVSDPECFRHLTKATVAVDSTFPGVIQKHAASLLKKHIGQDLKKGVDLDAVTLSITSTYTMAMLEWSMNQCSNVDLRDNLVNRTAFILMGTTLKGPAGRIEQFLSEYSQNTR